MNSKYSILVYKKHIFVNMDAVDVAFTEAAVGSGISTILFLAALRYLPVEEAHETRYPVWSLFLCGIVGLMLIIAAFALPEFGDPNAPVHQETIGVSIGRWSSIVRSGDHVSL